MTLIATIFNPLTFIVGLYGMNFDTSSPYNMPELHWKYGYIYVWCLMAVTLMISVGFYVWRGWLNIDRRFFSFQRPQLAEEDEA